MDRKRPGPDPLTSALRLLSYRARSVRETRERLLDKGFEAAEVDSAVEYLLEAGYLDDERYARDLVSSRVRNKGWGRTKIASDLRKRGVAEKAAAGALSGLDDESERSTAEGAARKWLRKSGRTPPLDRKDFLRAFRHLKARGFATGVTMDVLKPLRGPGTEEA